MPYNKRTREYGATTGYAAGEKTPRNTASKLDPEPTPSPSPAPKSRIKKKPSATNRDIDRQIQELEKDEKRDY